MVSPEIPYYRAIPHIKPHSEPASHKIVALVTIIKMNDLGFEMSYSFLLVICIFLETGTTP